VESKKAIKWYCNNETLDKLSISNHLEWSRRSESNLDMLITNLMLYQLSYASPFHCQIPVAESGNSADGSASLLIL